MMKNKISVWEKKFWKNFEDTERDLNRIGKMMEKN